MINIGLRNSINFNAGKSQKRRVHFWLRAECKHLEKRTILMPKHVRTLVEKGHQVTVEKSTQRAIPIEDFAKVHGIEIAEEGTWINAPEKAIICGLKELPLTPQALSHSHIYFAHCFKNQYGYKDILRRYAEGRGRIYDLEFLEQNGRRVAAFGEAAGSAGTAVAVLAYIWNKSNPELVEKGEGLPSIDDKSFATSQDFADYVNDRAKEAGVELPSVHIIGALGQVGTGARKMVSLLGIPEEKVTLWDVQETKQHDGPYKEVLDSDIFVNCINLKQKGLVFLNNEVLQNENRKLSIISDISCDYTNPANPIPVYSEGSSFAKPTNRIIHGKNPLDVVAIDYLPTLIPNESSELFGDKLLPHLLQFDSTPVWQHALDLFYDKLSEVNRKE